MWHNFWVFSNVLSIRVICNFALVDLISRPLVFWIFAFFFHAVWWQLGPEWSTRGCSKLGDGYILLLTRAGFEHTPNSEIFGPQNTHRSAALPAVELSSHWERCAQFNRTRYSHDDSTLSVRIWNVSILFQNHFQRHKKRKFHDYFTLLLD